MDFTVNPASLDPDDLRTLQQELQDVGYYSGVVDGDFGPMTRKGWRLAQLAHAVQSGASVLVIDINHDEAFDDESDFQLLWDLGVRVIIHKVSQGAHYRDPSYSRRKVIATRPTATRGAFCWGGYHFSSGHDVQSQIANFFGVEDGSDQTMAYDLDWEDSADGTENMPLASALTFMTAIEERTGAPGWVYGSDLPRESTGGRVYAVLARANYWQAGKGEVPPTFLAKGMSLFQYADTRFAGQPGVDLDRPVIAQDHFLACWPLR